MRKLRFISIILFGSLILSACVPTACGSQRKIEKLIETIAQWTTDPVWLAYDGASLKVGSEAVTADVNRLLKSAPGVKLSSRQQLLNALEEAGWKKNFTSKMGNIDYYSKPPDWKNPCDTNTKGTSFGMAVILILVGIFGLGFLAFRGRIPLFA